MKCADTLKGDVSGEEGTEKTFANAILLQQTCLCEHGGFCAAF